jgi:lysophospholipase
MLALAPGYAEAGPQSPRCDGYSRLGAVAKFFGLGGKPVDPTIRPPLAPGEPRPVSTSDKTLEKDYRERVLPFFETGTRGYFTGKDGVKIHHRHWEVPNAKGTIVLLHGASESMGLYAEMIYNLAEKGYNVYALDHRGHGHSGRMTADPDMLYVERFSDYVDDVETFVDQVVKPNGHSTFNIVSSSMGAQIGTQYAQRHPENVERLVASTPMYGIKFPFGLNTRTAQALANSLKLAGKAKSYAPGEGKPPAEPHMVMPEGRPRYSWKARGEMEDPDPLAWGVSVNWTATATQATFNGWAKMNKLTMPVLLIKAGQDTRIKNSAVDGAARRMPNAKVVTYPEASHSIVRANDAIRDPMMRDLFDFLETPVPASVPASGTAAR